MNINKIKETIRENKDGFTISLKDYKSYEGKGYAVAFTNFKGKNALNLIRQVSFVRRVAFNQLKDDEIYLGGWYNSEDKNFYLDLSFISEDINEVKTLMRRFNQIGVFSFKDFNTYKLKGEVLVK